MSNLPCCARAAARVTIAEADVRQVARLLASKDTAKMRDTLAERLARRDRQRRIQDEHLATHDGAS